MSDSPRPAVSTQKNMGRRVAIRAFLCDNAGRERPRVHNEGEKAGAQERDRGQVRPDKGQRQSRDPLLQRSLHGAEGSPEAAQGRHASAVCANNSALTRTTFKEFRSWQPRYRYPIDLHEEREGGFSVTFPDFDEAFTDGDTSAEAVAEASDCLEEALAGRIARREDIPAPSPARGPAGGDARGGSCRQDGTLRGPARRAVVQQRLCGGPGCSGKRGSAHARPPPCHQDRPAGGRADAVRESASSSPWKPPDRRSAPVVVSMLP